MIVTNGRFACHPVWATAKTFHGIDGRYRDTGSAPFCDRHHSGRAKTGLGQFSPIGTCIPIRFLPTLAPLSRGAFFIIYIIYAAAGPPRARAQLAFANTGRLLKSMSQPKV